MQPNPQRRVDYHEFPVLYVDDEPQNLRIFELTFRRDFSIVTAQSGDEALRVLHEQPVAVVLSDHRMPGMTGTEFLSRVREFDARTVRVLVTAYGDVSTLAQAINDGCIYRYVAKPWEPDDMKILLRQAIEVYGLDREREQLVSELRTLHRVSQALTEQLDVEPLLNLLLSTITDQLNFDAATLLFLDPSGERLGDSRYVPAEGEVAGRLRDLEITSPKARDFLRSVREGRTQLITSDTVFDLESPVRDWMGEVAAEEMLVVPLVGRHAAIGALAVDNRSGGRHLGIPEQTILEGLAGQAAIAIENARLVDALRRSGEQLMRTDRLGRLGTLAAGLAQEMRTPLESIREFVESNAPQSESHAAADRSLGRIFDLIDAMEQLGRSSDRSTPEHCDLTQLVEAVVKLMAAPAREAQVGVTVEHADEPPKLAVDRDAVQQVLVHLLQNAIQATPPAGEIQVRALQDERGGAVLEVQDTGPGIPAEDLERIFDPFFSARNRQTGKGLGLMICQRLVSEMGGQIEVASEPESGATFRVRLPDNSR